MLAGEAAGSGNTVKFANGQNCRVNSLTLAAGVYYWVSPGHAATITAANSALVGGTYANNGGNTLKLANGTRINGLSTCNIILDAKGTTGAVIGNSNIGSASCGYDRVVVDNSSGLKIINNNFTDVGTNAPSGYGGIGGYMPTELDIDGNKFNRCLVDCIDLPYGLGAEFVHSPKRFQTQRARRDRGRVRRHDTANDQPTGR